MHRQRLHQRTARQRLSQVPDPRREAKPLSESEIVDQARVSPDDIARARDWWRSHAPPDLKDVYDARLATRDEVIEPDASS
jgi:hypothetical protein